MSSAHSPWNELDAGIVFAGTGVCHHSIATIGEVEAESVNLYREWIGEGRHAGMEYMERYSDVRDDPRKLLDGAQSIICCAISYYTSFQQQPGALKIARYALGLDYHDIVRGRLETAAQRIREIYGGETRVCVDTAPLRERYWAERSGLGFIGRNNHLMIPGAGSYFFLGEILTTAALRPSGVPAAFKDAADACNSCGRCIKACPTGALDSDGHCDARRCLSYLTIEHRGEFPEGTDLYGTFYGCDRCAAVCPHNSHPAECEIEELQPNPRLLTLTADRMLAMDHEEYCGIFRGSAMKRAKLSGLQRNARAISKDNHN